MTDVPRPAIAIRAAAMPAGTLPALTAGFAAAATAAVWMSTTTGLGATAAATAIATYAAVAMVVLATIGRGHHSPAFGLPNLVTLARALAAALLVGYTAEVLAGFAPSPRLGTAFAALAGLAILADGLDGWLARSRGPATPFGARFDMEIDAMTLLALSGLAYGLGKAGAGVILIGAMRYVFVAAGFVAPWLAAPLPPSFRRKAICVLQGGALTALALPAVTGLPAEALTAAALAALAWSFAVDILWLAARRRSGRPAARRRGRP